MDQNIEESLNLESAMGVDFEHSGDVVIQPDIGLQESTSQEIPMDFESTEEQSLLMDTENEEIIVSDFMGDSLSMSEYTLSNEHSNDMATLDPTSTSLSSQSDTIVDLQYNQQATLTAIKSEPQQRIITVKTISTIPSTVKRMESGVLKTVPRQVAIAPKPVVSFGGKPNPKGCKAMGHVAIAPKPKPVTVITNKSVVGNVLKKASITGVSQATSKGNSVLAQIGKQFIMVPSGAQKIKFVSSNSLGGVQYVTGESGQTQILSKSVDGQNKPILQKLLAVQGQQEVDNQPVVITKIIPDGSTKMPQARLVTVQNTAPSMSLGNRVFLSPTKAIPAGSKMHDIIAIHAPKIAPAPGSSNVPENKVLIPANPKKVVVKPVSSQNTIQMAKRANISDGQQTQLHSINVPGKGVQYIRLITNSASATAKPVTLKTQAAPAKTFVLTDSKGNLIHMTAEKMTTSQPPSLVISNKAAPPKLAKFPQKLVRIAPIAPKTSQAPAQARPTQSLLAPISAVENIPIAKREVTVEQPEDMEHMEMAEVEIEIREDTKEPLKKLIEENIAHVESDVTMGGEQDSAEDVSQTRSELSEELEQDLIVIPSNIDHVDYNVFNDKFKNARSDMLTVTVEGDANNSYLSPTPALSDAELTLRPRKACNCTKSQCLKLYCDCFANGEFCNQCNCNNCHNNLENEELRQKAIRGCLDRNPHAFRPKIGKTKSGGPDIIRRHNKGCNCKRSGCLKNYCECYEAKIACTAMCKCIGCRNVEESLERGLRYDAPHRRNSPRQPPPPPAHSAALDKQPCTFMTGEVIDAVCQCLIAVAVDREEQVDPVRDVIEEFARCLRDIITTAHHHQPENEGAA